MGIPTPPPQPYHLQSQPLIAMLPSERWGPPVGPRGRAGYPPSILPCWGAGGQGRGLGKPVSPSPSRLLCQCLTSWSDTPSLVPLSPKGDYSLHFYFPPKVGTAREVRCSWAPRRTAICAILDGVGSSGGGGASASGPLCCTGGLPSAKHFPLSRSKNTKLGTPGAPYPGSPAPFPPPPQMALLGGGPGRECKVF